jgi:ESCRT-II complex subunit VPS25
MPPRSPYPPYYSYTPFWTLQRKNPKLLEQQLRLWDAFLTTVAHLGKKDKLKIIDALETPLFYNKTINRRLGEVDVREVIDFMVKIGHAEWANDSRTEARIIWRTNAEWFAIFEDWVKRTVKWNEILTFYEICEDFPEEEFYKQEPQLLIKVFTQFERSGKIQLIRETNPNEWGVKFIR